MCITFATWYILHCTVLDYRWGSRDQLAQRQRRASKAARITHLLSRNPSKSLSQRRRKRSVWNLSTRLSINYKACLEQRKSITQQVLRHTQTHSNLKEYFSRILQVWKNWLTRLLEQEFHYNK